MLARFIKMSILETLQQDYIRTARSKGLQERMVLTRHALRNALIPVVTVFGLQLGQLPGWSGSDRVDLPVAGAGEHGLARHPDP